MALDLVEGGDAALRGKFSRVVLRVNGLLRSTCLKAAPFRSDSQFDHDVCVTRIYKWMEQAGVADWLAGWQATGGRGTVESAPRQSVVSP